MEKKEHLILNYLLKVTLPFSILFILQFLFKQNISLCLIIESLCDTGKED